MADQTRKPKPKKSEEQAEAQEQETTESKTEEIDDLLDEIDEVLEVNSEEFVRSFIQKGGELVVPVGVLGAQQNRITTALLFGLVYIAYRLRGRFQNP